MVCFDNRNGNKEIMLMVIFTEKNFNQFAAFCFVCIFLYDNPCTIHRLSALVPLYDGKLLLWMPEHFTDTLTVCSNCHISYDLNIALCMRSFLDHILFADEVRRYCAVWPLLFPDKKAVTRSALHIFRFLSNYVYYTMYAFMSIYASKSYILTGGPKNTVFQFVC